MIEQGDLECRRSYKRGSSDSDSYISTKVENVEGCESLAFGRM